MPASAQRRVLQATSGAPRAGRVRRVVLASGAIACIGALAAAAVSTSSRMWQSPNIEIPLQSHELSQILVRVGLDPESLCAAGATPQTVTQAVAGAEGDLESRIESVREAMSMVDAASRQVDRLERSVLSGGGEQATLALASARMSLASASTAWNQHVESVFQAATDHLTPESIASLRNIRANRHHSGVPVEYLLISRTEAEWVGLRDALAQVRGAEKAGVAAGPETQIVVANANAAPATIAARQNLQAHGAQCAEAFMTAVRGR